MKTIGTIVVLGIALVLAGCGSSSNHGNINGNWSAALMNSASGNPVFNFTATFTQASASGLSITNLTFTTATPCFAAGTTATGGFTLSGNQNGVTSGGFQMNVQSSGATASNLLTLQGTVNNNTITGTWTLTGTTAGCAGSGNFTMNRA